MLLWGKFNGWASGRDIPVYCHKIGYSQTSGNAATEKQERKLGRGANPGRTTTSLR